MTTNLVLTVIGDDEPGLVESLAQTINDNSGNWLESSMSQLAGKFAGILRVSIADEKADRLIQELKGLSTPLTLVIEKVDEPDTLSPPQTIELNLVGNDRPGIIREISAALASLSVNVEQLNTECVPAPMSGAALFKAKASLKVPTELALEDLQSRLEQLADDLIVEIELA
ncbi:MAG: glycine cleavage system protein R [SAR86 cluster bacterium]|uniref:Glycine cleavage system transcriptional repressor n=1 Tax=SAR86 cluster bacterium TaxID=2030880 RepID=A0A2A5BB13_9GAMM|nr:MAG: glycine cleavage system protein R [SAR86 cluster bacterium]